MIKKLSQSLILLVVLSTNFAFAKGQGALGQAEFYWLMNRACFSGDELAVSMLLKAGADPSGVKSYDAFLKKYNQPFEPSWHLIQASAGGYTPIVAMLLRAGADPNLAEGEGVTALTVAAEKGHSEVVELLVKAGANKNYRTSSGTAFELALRNHHKDVLMKLAR